ncbi:MAG TPA: nucleotidyltransferase domain-containing protein [Phycisphaerae bacterium]|nr:nucleotidyltransferase domain-containing protein [Phycisphaerae bacterium]
MNSPVDVHERLTDVVKQQPYPLIFATISGAHLYGFPSPDSDYDLRGVHVLPVRDVIGIDELSETIEVSRDSDGLELDLVTHDLRKFALMMLKRNGYVLEQLFSPLVVHTSPEHDELKEIGRDCITKHHAHHYLGFVRTQWKLFQKENPPRIKPLLYVYRVLLTGIHLMHTGKIEANLRNLNQEFRLPFLQDLIDAKVHGKEKSVIHNGDLSFHESEYARLTEELEQAHESSQLSDFIRNREALNDFLIRVRLNAEVRPPGAPPHGIGPK